MLRDQLYDSVCDSLKAVAAVKWPIEASQRIDPAGIQTPSLSSISVRIGVLESDLVPTAEETLA